jgi:hypothetical protein
MMSDWLATSEALQHVMAIEMNPEVSREKIVREIRRGTLPAKATKYSTGSVDEFDRFLSAEELRHGNVHMAIDFEAGSAVITFSNYAMGHLPYGIHKASGLVVSKRHLYSIWPGSAALDRDPGSIAAVEKKASKPHRPAGTTKEKADAPLLERMRVFVEQEGLSPTAAAWKVVEKDGSGVSGNALPESKIRRLVQSYKGTDGNGE